MSQARVYTSPRNAGRKGKRLVCESCRNEIPKGEPYRWFKVGFRSRYKHVRCMRHQCTPTRSQLESSKMSGVYAAVETAESAVNGVAWGGDAADVVQQLKSALEDAGSEFETVADEYSEAAEAMGGAGEQMKTVADSIRDAASELSSFEPSEDEPDFDTCENVFHDDDGNGIEHGDTAKCDECSDIALDWLQDAVNEAIDALNTAVDSIEAM